MKTKVSEPSGKYNGSFKRAWFNWDYNRKTNILWVLGYGYNSDQSIFGIDADTGNFKYEFNLGRVGTTGSNSPYKFVTALSSGKVLIYGGATADYNAIGCLYDPTTNTKEIISGNSKNYLPVDQEKNIINQFIDDISAI